MKIRNSYRDWDFVFFIGAFQLCKFRGNEAKDDKCSSSKIWPWYLRPKILGKLASSFASLLFCRWITKLFPNFLKYIWNIKTWQVLNSGKVYRCRNKMFHVIGCVWLFFNDFWSKFTISFVFTYVILTTSRKQSSRGVM